MQREDPSTNYTRQTYVRNNRLFQNQKQRRSASSNCTYEQRNNQQRFNHNYNNKKHNLMRYNYNNNKNNQNMSDFASSSTIRVESDIPNFSFDPVTQKYYKILPNMPGQVSILFFLIRITFFFLNFSQLVQLNKI